MFAGDWTMEPGAMSSLLCVLAGTVAPWPNENSKNACPPLSTWYLAFVFLCSTTRAEVTNATSLAAHITQFPSEIMSPWGEIKFEQIAHVYLHMLRNNTNSAAGAEAR